MVVTTGGRGWYGHLVRHRPGMLLKMRRAAAHNTDSLVPKALSVPKMLARTAPRGRPEQVDCHRNTEKGISTGGIGIWAVRSEIRAIWWTLSMGRALG